MSLYFVRHQHTAETCPAKNPQAGEMLRQHLGPESAGSYGLEIKGEAVLDGEHTLVLIVETQDPLKLHDFMQPFHQAGSVEVWPASACEDVISREGC